MPKINVLSILKMEISRTSKIFRTIAISLLLGLRPLLGPACCKFSVSCTDFAVLKLKEGPFFHALWEIIKRISRCQSFYRPL
jgi:putative component of membrane protein insertase Oxa1/YidC/SpoIIIJ protein YidD